MYVVHDGMHLVEAANIRSSQFHFSRQRLLCCSISTLSFLATGAAIREKRILLWVGPRNLFTAHNFFFSSDLSFSIQPYRGHPSTRCDEKKLKRCALHTKPQEQSARAVSLPMCICSCSLPQERSFFSGTFLLFFLHHPSGSSYLWLSFSKPSYLLSLLSWLPVYVAVLFSYYSPLHLGTGFALHSFCSWSLLFLPSRTPTVCYLFMFS